MGNSRFSIYEKPTPSKFKYKDDESINKSTGINTPKVETLTPKDQEEAPKLTLKLKKKMIQSSSFHAQAFPMLVSLITG